MAYLIFQLVFLSPVLPIFFFLESVKTNISHIGTYGLLVVCAGILFNIICDISSYFRDCSFGFFKHIKTALAQKLVQIFFRGEPICVVKAVAITWDNTFGKECCGFVYLHRVLFAKFFGFLRYPKNTPAP